MLVRPKKTVRACLLAILLPALLSVAGCGAADNLSSDSNDTPGATAADTDGAQPAVRNVNHLKGESAIPASPQRIASLDYRLTDFLLALGLKPYASGTYPGGGMPPYLEPSLLEGVQPLGDEVNPEAVLNAAPDVILGRKAQADLYDQLKAIAPTVIADSPSEDWKEELRSYGAMFGREAQAEEWLSRYEREAEAAKANIAKVVPAGSTFLYLRILPKEVRVHGPKQALSDVLYGDLGLTPARGVEALDDVVPISLEVLPDYDADYIFVEVGAPNADGDQDADDNRSRIEQTSVWKNLKAVKAGHVYEMPQWVISEAPHIKEESLKSVEKALTQP
ncbi:ABC transporter substrate-binding protein [Saccharibacillus endophyticus]|uniref:Ferrichrome ABC transporter substrate-binding protein n=1 Tax=Saccharibacillus endophyticus TaxID=2060666 RepID=A0ABQ1ZZ06_9BACL|nr:ABC transporter substrate-binding protein [Saccharibacillus endophyticus]GGH80837.1 ferrichrome ABC transporter substrate-binding protein [Saccharibacillus endophyticus]